MNPSAASVGIALIGTADVGEWLPRVRDYTENMAQHSGGRYLREDIEEAVAHGTMQLWLVGTQKEVLAVGLTEIIRYPRSKACRMIACVGARMRDWSHLNEFVRLWAREQGCDRMEALCRKGWERVLARHGYRPFHILLEGTV